VGSWSCSVFQPPTVVYFGPENAGISGWGFGAVRISASRTHTSIRCSAGCVSVLGLTPYGNNAAGTYGDFKISYELRTHGTLPILQILSSTHVYVKMRALRKDGPAQTQVHIDPSGRSTLYVVMVILELVSVQHESRLQMYTSANPHVHNPLGMAVIVSKIHNFKHILQQCSKTRSNR